MLWRCIYILTFAAGAFSIFSGNSVHYGDYPFFATLIFTNAAGSAWICGGSLLNASFIVTAGHCTASATVAYIYLNTAIMLSPWSPGPSLVSTVIRTNPAFSTTRYYNDVGFVMLSQPSDVPPIRVASSQNWAMLQQCQAMHVVGRGYSCAGGCLPNTLQHVTLPYIPKAACVGNTNTQWTSVVVGDDVCMGYQGVCASIDPEVARDATCSGDSGSPVFDDTVSQFGIVSRVRTVQQNLPNWPISLLAPFWRRRLAAPSASTRFGLRLRFCLGPHAPSIYGFSVFSVKM